MTSESTGLQPIGPDVQREIGTVSHQGRQYASGGALIAPDRLVAYLSGSDRTIGATGHVTTWAGEVIGHYVITGRWPTPRSWQASHRVSARVTLPDGRIYHVRGFGAGMVAMGRRDARQRRAEQQR